MLYASLKNRIFLSLVLSFLILALVYALSPFLYVLNKNIQNHYYSLRNSFFGVTVSENIVLVTIDKKTLEQLGRFPFQRDVYVSFLESLKKAGVASVAFDILFLDKTEKEYDVELQKAISDFKFVTLGSAIIGQDTLEPPLQILQDASFAHGFLPVNVNISNKVVYSFSPRLLFAGEFYEHFALATLRSFYTYLYERDFKQIFPQTSDNTYQFSENISFPFSSSISQEILIHFLPNTAFKKFSFGDIYTGNVENKQNLKDAIVLVGVTADGIKDEFFTPNGLEYGIYIHANILNTLLTKNFLVYFDTKGEWILVFLLIIFGTYCNLSSKKGVVIMSNLGIFFVFILLLPITIFLFTNLLMRLGAEMVFALIMSLSFTNGIKYFIENMNKKKLKNSLSEYVGVEVANEVLDNLGKINFDGEEKKVVLFFSDIEGFTPISEHMVAKELVSFLRNYLSEMSYIILDRKGYINKYQGDAIMALWGVFDPLKQNDYFQACDSALGQIEVLQKLNLAWKKLYNIEVHIRIGIHAGEVIVGNIGVSGKKVEFTALGDNVNLASRLEGVNKHYGTYICVSETVYLKTKQYFDYRFIDKIRVKGRQEILFIYELLGKKNTLSSKKMEILNKFIQAQELYFKRDFKQAEISFSELIELGDIVSKTFKARCSTYILTQPELGWDGVWDMQEK